VHGDTLKGKQEEHILYGYIIELIDICMEIEENSWMWLGIRDDYLGIYLFCTYYLLFTLFAECTGGVSQMGLFVCGLNLGWLFY
jgi:hypothetical protein